MDRIVAFYRGEIPDQSGRKIEDLWQWHDGALEIVHNYVQWLFPNRRPSGVNFDAPLLDDSTVAAFKADAELRERLAKSHDLMLRFYGLEYDPETKTVDKALNYETRSKVWLRRENHNHLRITRILLALSELGLRERAVAFFECLKKIRAENPLAISDATLGFWERAARDPNDAQLARRPRTVLPPSELQ